MISSDGDIAALIELVSDNKVRRLPSPPVYLPNSKQIELTVDTTHAQAARNKLEWNSKKTGQ